MKTAKQEAVELLDMLPDDVTMETLIAELRFKASVLRGLEQAARGEGISHDEVKQRVRTWLESSGRRKLSGT
jgi:hypothetical protein